MGGEEDAVHCDCYKNKLIFWLKTAAMWALFGDKVNKPMTHELGGNCGPIFQAERNSFLNQINCRRRPATCEMLAEFVQAHQAKFLMLS